jgi:glutamine cyclotransferase
MVVRRRKGGAKADSRNKSRESASEVDERMRKDKDDHDALDDASASTRKRSRWMLAAISVAVVIAVVVSCVVVFSGDENTGVNKSSAAAESGAEATIPTNSDSNSNTDAPTAVPSASPTKQQQQDDAGSTGKPTDSPTTKPTDSPTGKPTDGPSAKPSSTSTKSPSESPTAVPSDSPTAQSPLFTTQGTFELLETAPHDDKAFTQGLELVNSTHYWESTGLYGESQVRIVNIQTGEITHRHIMDDQYFGEGMCYYTDAQTGQGRLIQLTWKEQTGFLYDPVTLEQFDSFSYSTTNSQGWGITFQPETRKFLVSDGSQYLHTWAADRTNSTVASPTMFEETSKVAVWFQVRGMQAASTLNMINELEWDPFQSDTVLANVFYQDSIVRIDIATGFVTAIYNLQSLFPNRPQSADVLNGIAVTSVANELWVTGKLWPNMYRIRLVD